MKWIIAVVLSLEAYVYMSNDAGLFWRCPHLIHPTLHQSILMSTLYNYNHKLYAPQACNLTQLLLHNFNFVQESQDDSGPPC